VALVIARHVVEEGEDSTRVAHAIVERLRAPDLRCVFVFADWRLDPAVVARETQRGLSPAAVVGGSTTGVVGPRGGGADERPAAAALGLYGDWLRVGVGVATELPKSALTRSRDALQAASAALGTTADRLDPARHVAVTLIDGRCRQEETFCIGSAAAAPRIRFVGGCTASEETSPGRPYVWANGEALSDAGVVVVLDSELPCETVRSAHLVPTNVKTVVTAAAGQRILELDGHPAARRLAELLAQLGDELDGPQPSRVSFARYVDGAPYVRSITHLDGDHVCLATAVDVGHVLRLMRPGDLIGQTTRDLEAAARKVGGQMAALLAFSCIARHWEAAGRGLARELATAYAAYPTIGMQSYGEQSGMLLVNHTLTGLAIGCEPAR
jgi:hypothetical protein